VLAATAITWVTGLTGCSSAANTAELRAGDCLELGGSADRPQAAKAECGSPASNFKVVAVSKGGGSDRQQCPADVDSSYSMHSAFSKSGSTACLDIDWVIGGCMSVDPGHNTDPVRVDCNDRTVRHRQRATQILRDAANADQCVSGLGYAYDERRFTVCVDDVS
jgi:hypothetical protein